jgi:hypothetical protein
MSVTETLQQRGAQYGDFNEQARVSRNIKEAMMDSPNWKVLTASQKEALEMTAVKFSRILNGNPNHYDSWHDSIGYLTLGSEQCRPKGETHGENNSDSGSPSSTD